MTLEELLRTVTSSNRSDWNVMSCWGAGSGPSFKQEFSVVRDGSGSLKDLREERHHTVAAYMPDLSISLAYGVKANEHFSEPWTDEFPNPNASSAYVDLFYNNTLVYRGIYVNVDGGRAILPLPEIDSSTAPERRLTTSREWALARVVDSLEGIGRFDQYVNRARIEIED